MKTQLTLLMALFVIVVELSMPRSVSSQDKKPDNQVTPNDAQASARAAEAMKGLRDKLLTSSPKEIGLSGEDAEAKVWGVMTEIAFTGGVVTIISLRDGTASIYASDGGGILGGYSVQKQAKLFVAEAEKHLAGMTPAKAFAYPTLGQVKFYVLTQEGVYSSEADEKKLFSRQDALYPLFFAGNEVLIGLRIAGERMNQTKKP